MARASNARHRELFAAVAELPEVHVKRLFGADAFFTRERMFAFLFENAIVLKLPDSERQDAIAQQVARPFLADPGLPYARWAELPLDGPDALKRARRLGRVAHEFAQTAPNDGPRRRKRRRPTRS